MARAIDQFLAAIRQAIYGRDVREAIASGIEQCYNDSTASAQKADIEAKGAEVLASIPDTYEDLQNDVDNLKSAFGKSFHFVKSLANNEDLNALYEPGYYATSYVHSYVNAPVNTASSRKLIFIIPNADVISATTQRLMCYLDYTHNRIYMRLSNAANWFDWQEFAAIDNTLTLSGVAADAKSTGDAIATTFRKQTTLANGDDLNELYAPGWYNTSYGHNYTNAPVDGTNTRKAVVVIGNSANIGVTDQRYQYYIDYTNARIYVRVSDTSMSTGWHPWKCLNALDETLTLSGVAADADATGNRIERIETAIAQSSKNLFVRANLIDAYFGSDNTIKKSTTGEIVVFIPCDIFTTYTVSKKAGNRFAIGYTTTTPAVGVMVYSRQNFYAQGTKLSVRTGKDARYLVAWVRAETDTTSITDMLDSVQIEIGDTATKYEPVYTAVDYDLRNNAQTAMAAQMRYPNATNFNGSGTPFTNYSKVVTLLHCSDLHGQSAEFNTLMNWANNHNNLYDDILCTGDIVEWYREDEQGTDDYMDFWHNTANSDKILVTIGNHDAKDSESSSYAGWPRKTMAHSRELYMSTIDAWGVTSPSGTTYWYKDYTNNVGTPVRLIGLDSTLYWGDGQSTPSQSTSDHEAQLAWFANVLADAKTNGMAVVVAQHYQQTASARGIINCDFSAYNMNASDGAQFWMSTEYLDAVDDFISGGGEFICWLCGHTHVDYVCRHPNHTDQWCFCVTSLWADMRSSDQARIANTESFIAANIVAFDTTSKLVKISRIGADYDYALRPRKTFVWNYQTRNMVRQSSCEPLVLS